MNGRNEAFAEVEALTRTVDKLDERLDQISRSAGGVGIGQSTMNVHAGGVGVWIASACAAVSMVIAFFLGVLFLDHSRKIDTLRDYIAAIYAQAPHLQPTETEKEAP